MDSATVTPEVIREHAQLLLTAIGVSRIIIVDDEYAESEVEELLGLCSTMPPEQAATLPHHNDIDFDADREIWTDLVRDRWKTLDSDTRRRVVTEARALVVMEASTTDGLESEDPKYAADTRAAQSLEDILEKLDECEYLTLSLKQWSDRKNALLADDKAANTILLFDRDFSEEDGSEDEGISLIREVQGTKVGYYGLLSHTVHVGSERDLWRRLTEEYGLDRDTFIVIAKARLTGESQDYYQFLRMLRFATLNGRYAGVKSNVWSIFEQSVADAKAALEGLSVLDFDRIVFGSSRREGVWEPDTLFRVFEILMRRESRIRLHQDENISAVVADARRISVIPRELAIALGEEEPSREALRIQRFENYDSADELNRFHVPIEIGDIFEKISTERRYILLAQPCDLMVRAGGKRAYENDKHGRTAALVELVLDNDSENTKDSWGELPFYDEDTGKPAFANFAKVHQVLLAALDLCVSRTDGIATIDISAACPDLLIDPWKERYTRLQRFFDAALTRYKQLADNPGCDDLKSLALPAASATVLFQATASNQTVGYDLKRVMRLRQPRSGALLTSVTQYQARVAFEHPFDASASAQPGRRS